MHCCMFFFFFFQAEDGIRDYKVTGVQTCALPISQAIKVDVRVIAATNKSLKEEVALGRFRDDLFYRLNVLHIALAPLRERKVDIPLLVRRFIAEFAALHERPFRGVTPEALQILVDADWPGNVRQLRDRKSTRLNSSHLVISYAVFCLKKKKTLDHLGCPRGRYVKPLRRRARTAIL